MHSLVGVSLINLYLKSDCEELWQKAEDKIRWSISKFREPFNFTQYLFPDYSKDDSIVLKAGHRQMSGHPLSL